MTGTNAIVPVDIKEVRALLSAATPGPWCTGTTDQHARREVRDVDRSSIAFCGSNPEGQALANAALIAAAPTLLAALCDEIAALRAHKEKP